MFRKVVTYTNYVGAQKSKELFFDLSLDEVVKLKFNLGDSSKDIGSAIVDMAMNPTGDKVLSLLEQILLASYGEIQDDGDTFMKTPEIVDRFKHSSAYRALYNELLDNNAEFIQFILQVLPKKLKDQMPNVNNVPTDSPEAIANYIRNMQKEAEEQAKAANANTAAPSNVIEGNFAPVASDDSKS